MTLTQKIVAFLTPARRRIIYRIVGIVGAVVVARGLMSAEDVESIVEILGLLLGTVAVPILADANIDFGDDRA